MPPPVPGMSGGNGQYVYVAELKSKLGSCCSRKVLCLVGPPPCAGTATTQIQRMMRHQESMYMCWWILLRLEVHMSPGDPVAAGFKKDLCLGPDGHLGCLNATMSTTSSKFCRKQWLSQCSEGSSRTSAMHAIRSQLNSSGNRKSLLDGSNQDQYNRLYSGSS